MWFLFKIFVFFEFYQLKDNSSVIKSLDNNLNNQVNETQKDITNEPDLNANDDEIQEITDDINSLTVEKAISTSIEIQNDGQLEENLDPQLSIENEEEGSQLENLNIVLGTDSLPRVVQIMNLIWLSENQLKTTTQYLIYYLN